ncbi:MAG: hypothetical protein N2445_01470 [Acidobacteria bacterium]|nr:hypothetical protein [Acidobacteriota bacterium]
MKKLILLFFLFIPASLLAEEVLKGKWDKSSYKLGDEAVLAVNLPDLRENFFVEGVPSPKSDLENFRISDVEKLKDANGKNILQKKMTIFATGKISFPLE